MKKSSYNDIVSEIFIRRRFKHHLLVQMETEDILFFFFYKLYRISGQPREERTLYSVEKKSQVVYTITTYKTLNLKRWMEKNLLTKSYTLLFTSANNIIEERITSTIMSQSKQLLYVVFLALICLRVMFKTSSSASVHLFRIPNGLSKINTKLD